MKKLVAILMICLYAAGGLCAQAETFDPYPQVRKELEALDVVLDDATYEEALAAWQEQLKWMTDEIGLDAGYYATKEYQAYFILTHLGMGDINLETWEWTPAAYGQVYALDAEFFNIEGMYTEFLMGVQAIVDDAVFANVMEDVSGIDWSSMSGMTDGHRDVAFTCNGHPYAIRLDSYGDWLNPEIIRFVNEALQKEGCRGQLHAISDEYDQMIILVYGDAERAAGLRELLGTEPWSEASSGTVETPLTNLLDWLF